MIKNLVFDLGNVLVEFKPKDYMERLGFAENDIINLHQIIFKDKRWNEFDRGTLTIDKYVEDLKNENPEYAGHIDNIFSENWTSNLFRPKFETIEFLKRASEQYGIYVLSNVSQYVLSYVKSLGFWDNVNSGTYSYEIGSCKPEPEIYQAFFRDNNLNPQDCLFLDDLAANIEAAKKAGMNGIVFNDNLSDIIDYLINDRKMPQKGQLQEKNDDFIR